MGMLWPQGVGEEVCVIAGELLPAIWAIRMWGTEYNLLQILFSLWSELVFGIWTSKKRVVGEKSQGALGKYGRCLGESRKVMYRALPQIL